MSKRKKTQKINKEKCVPWRQIQKMKKQNVFFFGSEIDTIQNRNLRSFQSIYKL